MSTWFKSGVYGTLRPEAGEGLRLVEMLFARRDADLKITSIRDGTHMPGSLHPHGQAFDISKSTEVSREMIAAVLGPNFDVVEEIDHIHIEYDPAEPSLI